MAGEQAWVISILLQANLVQDFGYLDIPVFGAAPETIRVRLSNQYLSFVVLGLPMRGLTMVISFGGRMPYQKGFLQFPLFEGAMVFNCHAQDEL